MHRLAIDLNGLVVQKYIQKPALINNKKFDIRFFMLIACTRPYLVLTNTGYARVCLEDYQTTDYGTPTTVNKATHLTNNSIQKQHPKYKDLKDQSIMSIDQVRDFFIAAGKVKDALDFD